MIDIIIFYWAPGSGGDTLQRILHQDSRFCTVTEDFSLDESGKTNTRCVPWIKNNVSHAPENWYWKEWNHADISALLNWPELDAQKILIIPTHRIDQARWLQSNIPHSRTMGICYPKHMYPCVLYNWSTKTSNSEHIIENYQTPLHKMFVKKGVLGAQVYKDRLQFGCALADEVLPQWDINLKFENLLVGNIDILSSIGLDTCASKSTLDLWMQRQKTLYRWQWHIVPALKQALGYNSCAMYSCSLNVPLDLYDRILLKFWCKQNQVALPLPQWHTLEQANDFFSKI